MSYYPRYVDDFREAARYLKKMKEVQRLADGIADRCTGDEGNVQTLIRNYVGNPGEADEAFTKLPEKGKEYGRTWGGMLEKLKEHEQTMHRSASDARFSVSEDRWSNVSSRFSSASSGIQSYWKERYQAADRACARLALGEKHPDIEKALAELGKYAGDTKATVTLLKRDYNTWLREVRKLREFSAKDRDELRDVMCSAGEYEMEAKVQEVADRWAGQISSVYGSTLGQADRLESRAADDKLKKYKGSKEVSAGVTANVTTLEKLKNHELNGSNNPKIRAKLEYGKQKHTSLQGSLCSGGYVEFEMSSSHCSNSIRPGSGCRADCVMPGSTCMIIEIKPNSAGALREGDAQRRAYADGIVTWYKANKEELFSKYPNLKTCERDGKELIVDSRIEPYDFCPSSSDAKGFGEDLGDASTDLSESD